MDVTESVDEPTREELSRRRWSRRGAVGLAAVVTLDDRGCWGIDGAVVAWPKGTRLREFDGDVVLETPDGVVLGDGVTVLTSARTGRTVTARGLQERCGVEAAEVVDAPEAS